MNWNLIEYAGPTAIAWAALAASAALALSELFTVIPALTGTAARICGSGVPLMCAALFLPAAALLCSPKSDVRTGSAGKGTAA